MTATCATCRHWEARRPVDGAMGTCALGGPTPDDGCSDCHASESCERHEPRDKK